jgi:DNA ligase-1
MILDGELWGGVNTLERVQSVVRTKEPQDHDWKSFIFLGTQQHHSIDTHLLKLTVIAAVFDSPSLKEKVFEERMKIIEEYLKSNRVPFAALVKQEKCQGLDHLRERLREVEDAGGEGLMLRLPNSLYDFKR